ncbi:MAG: hypothetical protein SGI92_21315 [Bryobacteraceae bacterium]|nr:hypothetical protein [Bryobacteraceae bacterium]
MRAYRWKLFEMLGGQGLSGLPVALWHDAEFKESDVDWEAAVYIPRPVEPSAESRFGSFRRRPWPAW